MTRERLSAALEELKSQPVRNKPLSLRLSGEEQKRLYKAAKLQGIPPASLARVLIVTGLADLEALPRT
ncbi:MAG: hypothetical protein EPN53_16715 [Acidobacteria bacterium]|nr:MAG: hypothetical protein EPN53_16715 [Acidobacteriota bacterium]